MTTADGSVLGVTQIYGRAPRRIAFNIVLLAEGFTANEQLAFDNAAQHFVDAIQVMPPYDELMPKINIFRVNVTSTDSGASNPPDGTVKHTYFDASFDSFNIPRLLGCNSTTALLVATQEVPEHSLVIVVVNSPIYGGSGGSVAVFSLAPAAMEIAFHEVGHTAFLLADEYPVLAGGNETGHDHHPAVEPPQPNVTINTDRATLKWGSFVAATTPLPTMSNPDCSQPDSRPSPVPVGTVGLFEGAHYYHCGAYRPEYDCKMNHLGKPYCHICSQAIRNRIGSILPGVLQSLSLSPNRVTGGNPCQGTVTLTAPSLLDTKVGLGAFDTGTHIPVPGQQSTIAHVRDGLTIPAGSVSARFTVTTSPVAPHTTHTVTIIAGASVIKYAALTVTG